MSTQNEKPYYSLSKYYKEIYGEKVYKIALNANLTCPNRDGTLGTKGCIFCSQEGSGDFSSNKYLSIYDQIEEGKNLLSKKTKENSKYIAYFQAFTNTYGDINYLKRIYKEAISHVDIIGISIATRPDCLNDEILHLLYEISKEKKLWVELGLQTIHDSTATFIRRGFSLSCFDQAVENLNRFSIDVVVHLIIGLPNESKDDLMKTIDYTVSKKIQGVKLQLLHILKETDLATFYTENYFTVLSLDQYADWIVDCIERIPRHIVIHRITGDGPKNLLVAPLWSTNKKLVLNTIHNRFKERNSFQGKHLNNI